MPCLVIVPWGDCWGLREVSPFNISLAHVDPEARAGGGDDDDLAANVGDDPWTASKCETRHETPNLVVCDPSTPVPDATHAPGSRYGAQVDAFCCHHLDFAQRGWDFGCCPVINLLFRAAGRMR